MLHRFFLGTFLLLVITRVNWFALGVSAAGIFLFLFGLHIFRDLKGTASTWSEIYKERRGISPDGFTLADVPTIKGMGFIYMIMGLFLAVGRRAFCLVTGHCSRHPEMDVRGVMPVGESPYGPGP